MNLETGKKYYGRMSYIGIFSFTVLKVNKTSYTVNIDGNRSSLNGKQTLWVREDGLIFTGYGRRYIIDMISETEYEIDVINKKIITAENIIKNVDDTVESLNKTKKHYLKTIENLDSKIHLNIEIKDDAKSSIEKYKKEIEKLKENC